MSEPLVYTTKGNIPAADVRLEAVWEDTPEYTKLVLNYYLGDEVVRNDAHVYSKRGVSVDGVVASIGG